jgi:GYF domain 2
LIAAASIAIERDIKAVPRSWNCRATNARGHHPAVLGRKEFMKGATWYYVDNDVTVGPTTLEDISRQIRLAGGQSRFVWTEGMSDWTDASMVPAFSQLFQSQSLRVSSETYDRTEPDEPSTALTLSQWLRHELTEYLLISAYLYVCFGSVIFYKAAILRGHGIEFTSLFGVALVKALVLGKFILVMQALRIGERGNRADALLTGILKTSVLFVVLLVALSVIEEIIVGYFHGKASREALSEIAGGTLTEAFAVGALMLLILIPYFAFRGVALHLGDGVLWKLFTERGKPASEGALHRAKASRGIE